MPENGYGEPVGFDPHRPPDRLPGLTKYEANVLIAFAFDELSTRVPNRHTFAGLASGLVAVVLGVAALMLTGGRDMLIALALLAGVLGTVSVQQIGQARRARDRLWLWSIVDEYAFRLKQKGR
ncbi:hypothetical protein ACFWMR_02115 [Amycolatopsis thailandensis]|uniref:hypothetical protein n=1 Tax=Amycolatopsis thailandensis TaxID=589330 RepID=UPI003669632B